MKRKDLKVGEDYLYGPSTDWLGHPYRNSRVTVLDDQPWQRGRYYSSRGTAFTPPGGPTVQVDGYRGSGQGVLVREAPSQYNKAGRVHIVPAAHLRGPWETAHAEDVAAEQARDAARMRKLSAEQQRKDRVDAMRPRLEALVGHTAYLYASDAGNVNGLRIADLEALLDAAEGK